MLAQARQLQELSDPGFTLSLVHSYFAPELTGWIPAQIWSHTTQHNGIERQAKQDKGLQGCICEELGLMVSPILLRGPYGFIHRCWATDYIADERSEYYAGKTNAHTEFITG